MPCLQTHPLRHLTRPTRNPVPAEPGHRNGAVQRGVHSESDFMIRGIFSAAKPWQHLAAGVGCCRRRNYLVGLSKPSTRSWQAASGKFTGCCDVRPTTIPACAAPPYGEFNIQAKCYCRYAAILPRIVQLGRKRTGRACSPVTVRHGASLPTSKLATLRRMTISAVRWGYPTTQSWSGQSVNPAQITWRAVQGNRILTC